jgi:thioredoxin 1
LTGALIAAHLCIITKKQAMKKVNAAEFREIAQNHPYVVVKFTANWCGPCRQLSPIIKLVEPNFPQIEFLEIDVDHELDLPVELEVKGLPNIVFFLHGETLKDSNGEIKRLIGVQSVNVLTKAFESLLAKP